MKTIEDVLAALSGRGRWFETARRDDRDPRHQKMAGVMRELEGRLDELQNRKRERGPARLPLSVETVEGSGTRNRTASDHFTPALADAIQGMPAIEWAAIEWILDGGTQARDKLETRLVKAVRRSQNREFKAGNTRFWPFPLRRADGQDMRQAASDYVPDLVRLAVLELRFPNTFESQKDRAAWFGLTDRHWRRVMVQPYGFLQQRTQSWLGGGCQHIAARLTGHQGIFDED